MIERKIKELSIALEALSRIQGYEATVHFGNVSELLSKAIYEAKEPPTEPSSSRTDDDIPF